MQFLDLNLETINLIYNKLPIVDQAKLGITCTSLQYLYPTVEMKQLKLKKQVMSDINAINYRINIFRNVSERINGSSTIRYTLWNDSLDYCSEKLHIDYISYFRCAKFKTVVDADLWRLKNRDVLTLFYERERKSDIKFIKSVDAINKKVTGFTIIYGRRIKKIN